MPFPSRRSLLASLGLLGLAASAPAAALGLGLQPPSLPAAGLVEPVRSIRIPRFRIPRVRSPMTRFRFRQKPTRF